MEKREIKFNAWIPSLGIMLESVTIYGEDDNIGCSDSQLSRKCIDKGFGFHEDCITDGNGNVLLNILTGEDWVYIETDECVLLQLTTKKDVYGIGLFEGDIYKWEYEYDADYDGDMPIVKTSKGIGSVKNIFDVTRIDMAESEGKPVEKIGNIYENENLLTP